MRRFRKILTKAHEVWSYLLIRFRDEDLRWVASILAPAQLGAFLEMSPSDQAHAAGVARRLASLNPPAWALKGALLHDLGKPRGYGLFWRILVVLWPDPEIPEEPRFRRGGLRWARQIYRWHGRYGALRAAEAGVEEAACALILEHSNRSLAGKLPWLAEFLWADDGKRAPYFDSVSTAVIE